MWERTGLGSSGKFVKKACDYKRSPRPVVLKRGKTRGGWPCSCRVGGLTRPSGLGCLGKACPRVAMVGQGTGELWKGKCRAELSDVTKIMRPSKRS